MLTELQESLTSFDFFKKDVSFRMEQREWELDSWNALVGKSDR